MKKPSIITTFLSLFLITIGAVHSQSLTEKEHVLNDYLLDNNKLGHSSMSTSAKTQEKGAIELIWPQADAKWSYCLIGQNGEPFDKETWGVKGDTLINGVSYDIIGVLNDNKDTAKPDLLTRCQNDTVFRYVNEKEYPYFKFDMEIGDLFTTFRSAGWLFSWNDSTCSSVLPLRVIEKETLNINGVELNKYLLADTLFSHLYGVHYTPVYELVDRVGVINAYPFINNAEGTSCFVSPDYTSVEVIKYEDATHSFLFSECTITSVSDHPLEEKIIVYPNPVCESFNLNTENMDCVHYDMVIVSSLGLRVLNQKIGRGSTTINVENIPNGIYLVVLSPLDCPNKHAITKKIVINKTK